ncbi:Bcr/CflA family multidrug efflux MFS transporter [Nitrospirillum sp. BR 11828]|uniref:Bcr/CflA family multidrug efflux MFS transporter n=1 Tax=Nitrospirillum sp. BR 11828 TaxID=3104325 RepID=UPI002ACA98DE|nr:Bcr/CflA family multidrug efflux MFS transporter [Nitrospirillum sp. BR 11828]MDZ5649280.1 Bcr/CflA family multidrug efflux MFS transporter [Nitrospirillum sp. BR 11828]
MAVEQVVQGAALAGGTSAVSDADTAKRRGTGLLTQRGVGFVAMLALLMSFGPMSVDMYLPAMPQIAQDLGISQASVESSLTAFFLAFGLCQLFWGPLGDRFGRRGPILVGILLYLAGSAGCAAAQNITTLSLCRAMQAAGACAAPVLARAMVRDVFDRDRAASVFSMMMLVMGIAPMAAPLLGGQVLVYLDWRAIFWVQAGFGLVAMVGLVSQPETLNPATRGHLHWLTQLRNYGQLMVSGRFLGYALTSSMIYGGMFAYIAGTPFVYIDYFKVPAGLYGLLFGLNIVGMIIVNMINSRLVLRLGTDRLLALGSACIALFGIGLAIAGWTGAGGLWGIVAGLFLFMAFTGLIGANATAGALASYPHMAGTASALMGSSQFVTGAVVGTLVGWLADGTPWPMAAIIGGLGVLGLVFNRLLIR